MAKKLKEDEFSSPRRRPRWLKEGRDWDCDFC